MKKIKSFLSRTISRLKIYKQLLPHLSFRAADQTTLILCFDGAVSHGGLLDRLKGVISFYEVAKQKNVAFKIYFTHPFALKDFLLPNEVDWQIKVLQFNPFQDTVLYLMNQFHVNPVALIDTRKNKTYFIYCNIDYLASIHTSFSPEGLQEIWRNNYRQLFTTSKFLEAAISKLPQEKNIVCHTRFTSLMGDFADTTSEVLSVSAQEKLIEKIVSKLYDIQQKHETTPIYVLSDSVVFLNYIRTHTAFKTLAGTPKHVDVKGQMSSIEEHLKTFTDFYFISKSEQVYLLQIDQMYGSGFSKYAALIENKPFVVVS